MKSKSGSKIAILSFSLIALAIGLFLCARACNSLYNREHQKSVQNYADDLKMVKAKNMDDILDKYLKIANLRFSIKSGLLKSREIGSSDTEIYSLYELSKQRARTELEKRMKDYPVNSESYKSYKWLRDNLDDSEPEESSR